MTVRALALAFLILAVLAAPARAGGDRADVDLRYGYSITAGATEIGDLGFANIGVRFHLARQIARPLWLTLDYSFLNTNRGVGDDLLIGNTNRLALGAEYEVVRFGSSSFGGNVALAGGGAVEHTMWDRGTITRSAYHVGLESHMGFSIGHSSALRFADEVGFQIGLRFYLAEAPPSDRTQFLCAGACEGRPAQPPRDLGVLFHYGLSFGR